jgi:ketosteroid isomerase-like protein
VSNWSFSGGVSYTVGSPRERHDPQPTPSRLVYEGRVRHELASVLELWLDGLERGRHAHLPSLYAVDARLMLSEGRSIHGQPGIVQFWAGREAGPAGHLIFEDVRASGNVASVVARVVPPGSLRQRQPLVASGALVTVFEHQRGEWVIKSQLLVEDRPVITGP